MMAQTNWQGIIFDLDGTLVNTEPLHMRAWLDVLAAQGLLFDEHWFEQWIGQSDRILAEEVIRDYALPVVVEFLQQEKRTAYHAMAREQAVLFPQVADSLPRLATWVRLGIATSSSDDDAAAVFHRTKLDQLVETVVTADDVTQLKPAPDPYLLASQRLGLDPARTLALEDSPAGVRAAKTAGLYTLGVMNSHSAEKLAEADQLFPTTAEAIAWMEALIMR